MTELESQTLAGVIELALDRSSEPDPHVIAARLLPRLNNQQRAELVLAGLVEKVTLIIRNGRSRGLMDPAPIVAGPSKWSFAKRVSIDGAWKLLDDCDLTDLHSLAEEYRQRVEQMAARLKEVEQLAEHLRASGARTVGEMRHAISQGLAA